MPVSITLSSLPLATRFDRLAHVSRAHLLCASLVLALACSRPSSKPDLRDDDSEEVDERPRKKRATSSAGLVFEPAPAPTGGPGGSAPRPKLTFEPVPPQPTLPPLPPEVDFLSSGASRIVPLLEERVARPRFSEVVVRHDRVDLDVITGPAAVQRYQIKGNVVTDRGPEKVLAHQAKELQRAAFGPADVDWGKLPGVAKDALGRLPGASISHVHVERPLPFSEDLQVRVFVEGKGWVAYDARGRFREAHVQR
jgi:hypothetical protein